MSAAAAATGPVPGGEPWGACALTFDDGPDPVWTPRVLACLADEGARATFFVMARRAAAQRSLVDRMRAEGHEIALHCVRHIRHSELDERALRRDTQTGLRLLDRIGVRTRHWRAPWGVTTATSCSVAVEFGLKLVHWDLDTHDWRGDSAAMMHARVGDGLRANAVILMHDGLGPGATRGDCRETVRLIPQLIATLRSRRVHPAPVRELRP